MTKPVVLYEIDSVWFLEDVEVVRGAKVGKRCSLKPIDHPSILVSNNGTVFTSVVVGYDPNTGRIETTNTIYEEAPGDYRQ